MDYKPYEKVVTSDCCGAVCAIYEPHPFRNCAIKYAVEQNGGAYNSNTGIKDDVWCWVFYDWCGNPVGLSHERPEGEVVDKFTAANVGDENLAEYLNKEPLFEDN